MANTIVHRKPGTAGRATEGPRVFLANIPSRPQHSSVTKDNVHRVK